MPAALSASLCRAAAASIMVATLATVTVAVAAPADRIIRGGPIVTVSDVQPAAEAVAIADGRTVAVGSEADVIAQLRAA